LDDLPELEERIDTILCPVDMDQFHPAYGNVVNPIGSRFLLLTARILDPRKNVSMLLDAFARVRAAMPDINLAIIGDPPREIDVSKCEQLGLTQAVQFLPARSQTSLIPYYQSAELFVLPSTQEGLSISMLEAMACGLPVISTRCGGPEGVIQDGLTGRLTTNDDADSYADAILSVLSDPILLKEMRLAANSYAQRTYAQPIVMSRLHNVFARIYPQHFTNLG
jgi:glycosyltransferase involved in cell wall biosynthesis